MDLETLIPIIIIAVAYLFKAFENARKKKKKEQKPPSPAASSPEKRRAAPAKPVVKKTPAGRGGRPLGSEPAKRHREGSTPSSYETADRELTTPEMQDHWSEARRKTKENFIGNPVKARPRDSYAELQPEPEATHEYADFDLRDAVIKSAILAPYQPYI